MGGGWGWDVIYGGIGGPSGENAFSAAGESRMTGAVVRSLARAFDVRMGMPLALDGGSLGKILWDRSGIFRTSFSCGNWF